MADLDVAIVGGGAAGIAAARRLVERGRSVLLVEAMQRLGGRAHTVMVEGMPLDFGAGWLHSAERNPFVPLADAHGVPILRGPSAWHTQLNDLGFSAADQASASAAYQQFGERLRRDPPASDRAGDAMPLDDRWRPYVDGLTSFLNGAELDDLSAADFVAYDDAASDANWRIPTGVGTFIASLADGLPTALDTAVTVVREEGDVVLTTNRGDLRARAAIVTLSSHLVASGAIRFGPSAADHLHAASNLPLGLANKIYFAMSDPDAVPPETHVLGRADRAGTGSHYLRPFGRPIIECFLGGSFARALEEAGDAAAVAFAVDELRALLGADLARGLRPLAVIGWAHEPTVGGSYSFARPGQAKARAVLARPVSARLCFAGEATSQADYSTIHGAWASGIAAADHIDDAL